MRFRYRASSFRFIGRRLNGNSLFIRHRKRVEQCALSLPGTYFAYRPTRNSADVARFSVSRLYRARTFLVFLLEILLEILVVLLQMLATRRDNRDAIYRNIYLYIEIDFLDFDIAYNLCYKNVAILFLLTQRSRLTNTGEMRIK